MVPTGYQVSIYTKEGTEVLRTRYHVRGYRGRYSTRYVVPLQKYTAVHNLELLKIHQVGVLKLVKIGVLKLVEFGVLKVHTNSGYTKYKWTTSTSQCRIVLLRRTTWEPRLGTSPLIISRGQDPGADQNDYLRCLRKEA
eukprot:SAG11_NODE_3204_length_2613_cov_2.367940_3_plen_139_part_00